MKTFNPQYAPRECFNQYIMVYIIKEAFYVSLHKPFCTIKRPFGYELMQYGSFDWDGNHARCIAEISLVYGFQYHSY